MSEHESLRKALSWLLEHKKITEYLIGEASQRFDLSPLDEAFLRQYFCDSDHHRDKTTKKQP